MISALSFAALSIPSLASLALVVAARCAPPADVRELVCAGTLALPVWCCKTWWMVTVVASTIGVQLT